MVDMRLAENVTQRTAVIHEQVRLPDLPAFLGRAFDAVAVAVTRQGMHVTGPPFALYRGDMTETVDVEAGFPVAGEVAADGAVRPGSLPGGQAVETIHIGPYEKLPATYAEMDAWMRGHALKPAAQMWEAYLTDPADEAHHHPNGPQTLVVWPVQPTTDLAE